jgi:hypothetical protein
MHFRILDQGKDRSEWDALIELLPSQLRDVHMTAAYGRVQEELGGQAIAVVLQHGKDFVLQPFIRRAVPFGAGGPSDLVSPYGFGGPVSNIIEDPDELRGIGRCFRFELRQWCEAENVVSEFTHIHPLLAPDHQVHLLHSAQVIWTKPVVVINLETFSEATVRRRVRRGVKIAIDAGWKVREVGSDPVNYRGFFDLYKMSMDAKNASARWRFSPEYFENHRDRVGARWFYIDGHRALLTIGRGENAYAHFLGSDGERREDELDTLLYFQAAFALKNSGYRRFHLGGGLTSNLDDSLLAFKCGFSDLRYMAGNYAAIYDQRAYSELEQSCRADEIANHGRASTTNWFPAYRREFA